jgi:LPS-assembly lipoprotein
MRRRLLLGAVVALSGCGFALKRAPELSFKTIQLSGFGARSPLAAELRTQLDASPTTHVVESPADAQVVLQALSEAREKVVVAQTAANQIREFELRLRFNFRVRTVTGKDLIPDSEIVQRRSLTYTESAALAKEQEEAFLYRAMQADIASQILRRLASIRVL